MWWLVALSVVFLLACCAYVLLAGDREGQMVDEEPTLKTRGPD